MRLPFTYSAEAVETVSPSGPFTVTSGAPPEPMMRTRTALTPAATLNVRAPPACAPRAGLIAVSSQQPLGLQPSPGMPSQISGNVSPSGIRRRGGTRRDVAADDEALARQPRLATDAADAADPPATQASAEPWRL